MRPVLAVTLLGFGAFGCATSGSNETFDGSSDSTVGPVDGEESDQASEVKTVGSDTSAPDGTPPDSTLLDIVVIPPTDSGADTGLDAGSDAGADADGGVDANTCGELGMPCSYEAQNCPHPLVYMCDLAYVADASVDGSTDSGSDGSSDAAFEGGLGPVNDGVCMPNLSGFKPCNDGTDHCASTVKCLNASQVCLNAMQTTCICDNPLTASACGSP